MKATERRRCLLCYIVRKKKRHKGGSLPTAPALDPAWVWHGSCLRHSRAPSSSVLAWSFKCTRCFCCMFLFTLLLLTATHSAHCALAHSTPTLAHCALILVATNGERWSGR
jgi:hypothetical protein